MSVQDSIPLLSTLIGGLLAIAGGVLANYYTSKGTQATEKRKEFRAMLEGIYKAIQQIDRKIVVLWANPFDITRDDADELNTKIADIECLIILYLQPLEHIFDEYKKSITKLILDFAMHKSGNMSISEDEKDAEVYKADYEVYKAQQNTLQKALPELLKKQGYGF